MFYGDHISILIDRLRYLNCIKTLIEKCVAKLAEKLVITQNIGPMSYAKIFLDFSLDRKSGARFEFVQFNIIVLLILIFFRSPFD